MKKITLLFTLLTLSVFTFGQDAYMTVALRKAIQKSDKEQRHSVLIVLNEQIDFVGLKEEFKQNNTPVDERAKTVMRLLRKQTMEKQQPLINYIIGKNIRSTNQIDIVKQYWIANLILVETDIHGINYLRERSDINYLELASQGIELVEPIYHEGTPPPKDIGIAEPGLIAINARPMWALGYTGRGTMIYGYDTGVWPDHPSFSERYLGRYYPPEQCWYGFWNPEPTGILNDHGTHTLGTSIGLDETTHDTIGMAWGAYWIANDVVRGTIDEIPPVSDMIDAFEWALNPDGDISTVDDIPDVINNSWRWRDEADTVHCQGFVVDLMNAIEAVGIANVFSGGNSGPDNTSVNSPQRIKTNVVNTFCVGAINGNTDTYPIVYFSTRGPSQCPVSDTSLSIHPEVVAPGYYVRSAWGSNEYNAISGTSMSCPHVSGALLLLKEAFPYLTGEELMQSLYYTAIDMGEVGEDNAYGMGMIDVYAAYEYLSLSHTPVPPIYDHDIAITSVFDPESTQNCYNPVTPEIVITNLGTVEVNDFKLYYSLNGAPIDSVEWSGALAYNESVNIPIDEYSFPEAGENLLELEVVIDEALTEVDYYNNHRYFPFFHMDPLSVPFTESFESGIDSTLWTINNPDNGMTWDTTVTAGLDSGIVSMVIPFGYEAELYEIDEVISPPIDLSTASQYDTITLSFDLAYQKRSNTFQDSLKIYASDDCGHSYPYLIYAKNGEELSTYDVITPDFVPNSADQWRREFISLTGLEAADMVRFKFVGWNKRGNHLYIDNIRLDEGFLVKAEEVTKLSKIRIYPNPATNIVNIDQVNPGSSIFMYNSMGQLISAVDSANSNNQIDVGKCKAGVYCIVVVEEGKAVSKKIVID
jgi:subtilisin family serine protease